MTLPPAPLVIEIGKVTDYLPSRSHPTGRGKAAFFEAFGFDQTAPNRLAEALARHGREREVTATRETAFGISYEVRCAITTPDGRVPCIVSVWMAERDGRSLRLITAYPGTSS